MSDKLITLSGLSTFWNNIKSKFATAAQGAKADTALQKADIATGTANGSVSVDGSNVAVKGLASAAYRAAGSASGNVPVNGAALGNTANRPIVTNSGGLLIPHPGGALGSMAFQDSSNYATKATTLAGYGISDAYTKTQSDTALTNHKTSGDHDGRYYTESEVDAKINALNTKISAVSGQIGVAKILHGELNVQEWIDLFEGTQFGTAIIIMGTETDGAMFIVTKRLPAQCFIREIYNTGGYRCYRAENATETDRPILSLGRNGNYYTRDIIVMGSVR